MKAQILHRDVMLDRPAIDTDAVLAAIEGLRKEVAELREHIVELVQQRELCEEALSTLQAMALTGRSRQCVVNWCERYGIGRFDDERERWIISRSKLVEFCRSHPDASRHTFW